MWVLQRTKWAVVEVSLVILSLPQSSGFWETLVGWGWGGDCACIPLALSYPIYLLLGVFSRFSCVLLFVTPWTVACQAPLSMGFSQQEYWSGLPFPSPGDLPDPGIKPVSPLSSALAGGFFTLNHQGSPPLGQRVLRINSHVHITLLIVMLVHAKWGTNCCQWHNMEQ